MTADKKPFHEIDYIDEDGDLCPILVVAVGKDGKELPAYADTGCTAGIALFKEQIKDIDIGTKISDEPSRCIMADGHIIGADEYLATVSISGEKREVVISVIDSTKILGTVPVEKMTPLLGRDFLDHFDVIFKGKNKQIALFKC